MLEAATDEHGDPEGSDCAAGDFFIFGNAYAM